MMTDTRTIARLRAALTAGVALLVGACQTAPPPPPPSVASLLERPAERALAAGLVDYDDGAFDRAQTDFETAVKQGLRDPHDAGVAHKHLAFIACAFNHPAECEAHFRSAFAADPAFRLSDAEIGHPIWGPVYRRVAAARSAPQKNP
jgi:hypothetical protein